MYKNITVNDDDYQTDILVVAQMLIINEINFALIYSIWICFCLN